MTTNWSANLSFLCAQTRPIIEIGIVTLLRSALLLACAIAAGRLLRNRDPRTRVSVYNIGFAAVVLLLLLMPIVPIRSAHTLLTISLPTTAARLIPIAVSAGAREPVRIVGADVYSPRTRFAERSMPSLRSGASVGHRSMDSSGPIRSTSISPEAAGAIYLVVLMTWLTGAVATLIWLIVGQLQVRNLREQAVPVTDPGLLDALAAICREVQTRIPDLLWSDDVPGPFVTGIFRPCIVLPTDLAGAMDTATLRAILAHEVHHIVSRDLALTLVVGLLRAILWPQPLLWALAARWRESAEEACDLAALAQNCSPKAYANCLVALAETFARGRHPAAGLGMAHSRSSLGRRIDNILNNRVREVKTMSPTLTRATIGIFGVVALAACRIVTAQNSDPRAVEQAVRTPADRAGGEAKAEADAKLRAADRELYRSDLVAAQREIDDKTTDLARKAKDSRRALENSVEHKASSLALKSRDNVPRSADSLRAKIAEERAAERRLSTTPADSDMREAERRSEAERSRYSAIEAQGQAEKRAMERAYRDDRRSLDKLDRVQKSEYEKRAKEFDEAANNRSADVEQQAKRTAEAKRSAELDYNRGKHGIDAAVQDKRAAEQYRMAEQDYRLLGHDARLESRSIHDKAAAEQERVRVIQLHILTSQLAQQEVAMLKLQQKLSPNHATLLEFKAATESLRKRLDELTQANQYGAKFDSLNSRLSAEKSLSQMLKARAEMDAHLSSGKVADKATNRGPSRSRAEADKLSAVNADLRRQVAELRAEVERLRRQAAPAPVRAK